MLAYWHDGKDKLAHFSFGDPSKMEATVRDEVPMVILAALLERNGFEVERFDRTLPDLRVIFQLANAYLYKRLFGRGPYLDMIACLCFMAPLNLAGALLARLMPAKPDLYLDNVVLARKRVPA